MGEVLTIPLFSSDITLEPIAIIEAFVNRFSIEIMFEESRAHLGMETQRQWSDQAIIRSTPLIFALFFNCVLNRRSTSVNRNV